VAVVACLGVSVPTLAKGQLSANHGCPVESAQITVSFNGVDMDASVVKSKLDAKIAEIKAIADEQQFTKFVIQSYSYNISTNYNGGSGGEMRFQYSGSVSFSILPADKAAGFMELLAKKGYQASVSVSSYNNGSCSPSLQR
jgi:hypothetical protein